MRIHLKIISADEVIPFNHQSLLTGVIHKWLGWNTEHGNLSLYSFSRLEGGKATKNGLQFGQGTSFFFSSHDAELVKQLVSGIMNDRSMFCGLTVSEIVIQEDPDLTGRKLFFTASPIFIKRKIDENIEHIIYTDERASAFMKETLETKMEKAGLSDNTLSIRFDTTYRKAGTKIVSYNGIQNRASWCPVIVDGKPETKLFAWNVGLGNSTGIGFGAIK